MDKFVSLPQLVVGYRNHRNFTQLDLAAILDVDVRTVIRWEKGETILKQEVEDKFVTLLRIPYQVIHNLNSTTPIPIYYDLLNRLYASSAAEINIPNAEWFKMDFEKEDQLIRAINPEEDIEVIDAIQEVRDRKRPISSEILKLSIEAVPELNLIFHDHSGYYAGHLVVLRMKYSSYVEFRAKSRDIQTLHDGDIDLFSNQLDPTVYFFYVHYADSLSNTYYLMNRMLQYFDGKHSENYIFAAMERRDIAINLFSEMGLKRVWDSKNSDNEFLIEGDFKKFLSDN